MGAKLGGGLIRCGRCGKRYTNPFGHTCVRRMDSRRKVRRTRLAPKFQLRCSACGKPRGLRHTCVTRTDFRARKRRAAQRRKTEARQAKRRAAADRRREAAKRRKAATAARRKAAKAKARTARPRAPGHDPHTCSDPDCQRYGCLRYREGYEDGHGAVAVLTALAIGWLMRLARARDERIAVAWAEQRAALRASRPAQVAAPQPQAVAPVSVYVINVADADQAAMIRQALPGQSVPGGTRDSGPAA